MHRLHLPANLIQYSNRVMSKDLYKILGVPRNVSEQELRAAYRALVKKYHPDTGAGSSVERFREIQAAYETLSDPGRRAVYDRERSRTAPLSAAVERTGRPGRQERVRRGDPSHLDLSDVFSIARSEPIGRRQPPGPRFDPWTDWEEMLRILKLFDEPEW